MINSQDFIKKFKLEDCVVDNQRSQVIVYLDDADLFNNVVLDLEDSYEYYLEESVADEEFTKFVYSREDTEITVSANFNDDKYVVVLKEIN